MRPGGDGPVGRYLGKADHKAEQGERQYGFSRRKDRLQWIGKRHQAVNEQRDRKQRGPQNRIGRDSRQPEAPLAGRRYDIFARLASA